MASFEELNAQVLGISVDSVHSHRAYAEKLEVTFPLLADFHPKGEVSQAYGVWRDDWGTSRRAVFIIDEAGLVQYREIVAKGVPDVAAILEEVRRIVQQNA